MFGTVEERIDRYAEKRGVSTEEIADLVENDDSTVVSAIVEAMVERVYQNKKWGGAAHDDHHTSWDWCNLIAHQNVLAKQVALRGVLPDGDPLEWRTRMVKIAALAIAAVGSYDRLNPPEPNVE